LVLLNFIGVLRGKSILKSWRVAILCIILFAGIATPATDLMSMFLLAAPITLLYFLAAGVSIWHDRIADKRRAEEFAEYDLDDGESAESPASAKKRLRRESKAQAEPESGSALGGGAA